MSVVQKNINEYFEKLLADLKCQPDTNAYIVSIFTKFKSANFDLSKDSVTLRFAQAREKHDFLTYQNLGDWIFYSNILFPKHLHAVSKDYYDTVARLSYYRCYRIINKQWKLFEELADNYPSIELQVKRRLQKLPG